MVHPEVRNEVPNQHVVEAKLLGEEVENSSSNQKAEVAQEDELLVLLLVKWAGRVEVVDTAEVAVLLANTLTLALLVVVVVAGNVGGEVHQPTSELLGDGVDSGGDGSLLGELRKLVDHLSNSGCVDLTGLWHENHVAVHVASSLVVLAVGDLPGEVRDEESGVKNPANGVVDGF